MRWFLIVALVVIAAVLLLPKNVVMTGKAKDNNSPERMKKIRAIKKQKAEERNRSQMKAA